MDFVRSGASLLLLGLLSVGFAVLYAVPLFAVSLFILTEPDDISHGLSKYGPLAAYFTLLTGFGLAGVLLFRRALRSGERSPEGWTIMRAGGARWKRVWIQAR